MAEVRTTSTTGGQKGTKLQRFDLLPTGPLTALAEHYGVGASKYADNNYRRGYEWSKSYAALQRHLTDFWAGKDYDVCSNDPDGCRHTDMDGNPFIAVREDACFNHTGSHHLVAAAWHCFTLLTFVEEHPDFDDRYTTVQARAAETAAQEEERILTEQTALDAILARMANLVAQPPVFVFEPARYVVTVDGEVDWETPSYFEHLNEALNRRG